MRVHVSKSKIVHYRTRTQQKSKFQFKCGDKQMEIVNQYKYLGLVLDECLDFNVTSSILADSGGRALGAIYNKFRILKGLGYKTYSKMYHTGVVPILDYCAGIWSFNKSEKADSVQNRAIRWYLGVHKYAPNLAINGEMGWVNSDIRRKVEMLRYWNKLLDMDDNRLTKKVFQWDHTTKVKNWNGDMYKLFEQLDELNV